MIGQMNGAVYVTSDIHNEYRRFLRLMEKIRFKPTDTMYILGDLFDRGNDPEPIQLWQYIKRHENIIPVLGNHDLWLLQHIRQHLDGKPTAYMYNTFQILLDFCSRQELEEICAWIEGFPLYVKMQVGEQSFVMAHAQTYEDISQRAADDILMADVDYDYFRDGVSGAISVTGHHPTDYLRWVLGKTDLEGSRKKNRIYANSGKTVFCVDCGSGMGKPNDALGCLRLNDLKEFYA